MIPRILIPEYNLCPHPAIAAVAFSLGFSIYSTEAISYPAKVTTDQITFITVPPKIHVGSHETQYEKLIDFLCAPIVENDIRFGIAGVDFYLSVLNRIAEKVGQDKFTVLAPGQLICETLANKVKSHKLFAAWGIPIPNGKAFASDDEIDLSASTISFPCVFKRERSTGSNGVFLAQSKDELKRHIQKSLLLNQGFVVEQFLGRTREYSHQFFIESNAYFPAYSLLKHSHLGPSFSTVVELLGMDRENEIFSDFKEGLRKLDDGYYSAQFKEDENGQVFLIEINCRLGNNFRIIYRLIPKLGPLVILFYWNRERWRDEYILMRSQIAPAFGVSLIEELYCAFRRNKNKTKKNVVSGLRTILEIIRLLRKCPTLDFYFMNLSKSFRQSFTYYRNIFQKVSEESSDDKIRMRFVPR